MKSFNIVIRIHHVTDSYSTRNIRNIIDNLLGASPWEEKQLAVYVEQLRHLPDLSSTEPLSQEDLEYLEDLREVLSNQRDAFSITVRRITRRINAAYSSEVIPGPEKSPFTSGEE